MAPARTSPPRADDAALVVETALAHDRQSGAAALVAVPTPALLAALAAGARAEVA
jgi:hypothetical protein